MELVQAVGAARFRELHCDGRGIGSLPRISLGQANVRGARFQIGSEDCSQASYLKSSANSDDAFAFCISVFSALSTLPSVPNTLGGVTLAAHVLSLPIPFNDLKGRLEVQAHRGGLGQRSEESLWAFAYAMEIGVDILEMDTVFTQDGVPVIWHDHYIDETKCLGDYVGDYIANLTLEQVKTLDCSKQLPEHPQAELHPNTRIATLEEVLTLVDCYEDRGVTINLETKLDPTKKNETLPVEKYIDELIPILQKHNFESRTTIQSFDWRTLIGIKEKFPQTVTAALLDDETTTPDSDGNYPWLGGVNVTNGDWVAAAASINAGIVSPVHGLKSNYTINSPGYKPWVTKERVEEAHGLGIKIIPWTVDYEVTINKLIDDGVDAIISDYPERVMWIAKQRGLSSGRARNPSKPECLVNASG